MLNARDISSRDICRAPAAAEERRHVPRAPDLGGAPFRKHTRQVLGNATAGDVREALDGSRVEQRPHGTEIRAVRREQRVAHRGADFVDDGVGVAAGDVEQHPPRQRIAVGVRSRATAGR